MIKRREFLPMATVAATALAGASSLSQAATAACATEASTKDVDIDPVNLERAAAWGADEDHRAVDLRQAHRPKQTSDCVRGR